MRHVGVLAKAIRKKKGIIKEKGRMSRKNNHPTMSRAVAARGKTIDEFVGHMGATAAPPPHCGPDAMPPPFPACTPLAARAPDPKLCEETSTVAFQSSEPVTSNRDPLS